MTSGKQKSSFVSVVNPFTNYLGSSLRLSFCVPRRLPNKKWVSENYIAFARIAPFMFGTYFSKYHERNNTMALGNGILLQRLINAFNVLISTLMRPNQNDITRDMIDDVVKIYLSCLNDLDKSIGGKVGDQNNIGLWTKQNPLSLLNLGRQIERFGPLRFHWEGRNENKITDAKSDLSKMRSSLSFFQKKLQKIRRRVAIATIERQVDGNNEDGNTSRCEEPDTDEDGDDDNLHVNSEDMDNGDDDDDDDDDETEQGDKWYRGCYRYKSTQSLETNLANGNFVSCFLRESGGLWAFVSFKRKEDQVPICELRMETEKPLKCCGSSFFKFTVTNNIHTISVEKSRSTILRNCLLLPYHHEDSILFSGITDKWEIILEKLSLAYPRIDLSLYENEMQLNEDVNKRRRTS